jgi:inner membrane protein
VLVDSAIPDVDSDGQMRIHYKPEETAVTIAAKKSYLGRAFLDWAKYPLTETETLDRAQGGYLVRFLDLRFGDPDRNRRTPLSASVELDGSLHVVSESMGLGRRRTR